MMKKDADGKTIVAGHENCDCCKGEAESCPMKGGGDGAAMKMADGANCPMAMKDANGQPMKMGDGANCPMMKKGDKASADAKPGDAASCPMMKNADGTAVDMKIMHDQHQMKMADGTTCCCPCCQQHQQKEKTEAAPAA